MLMASMAVPTCLLLCFHASRTPLALPRVRDEENGGDWWLEYADEYSTGTLYLDPCSFPGPDASASPVVAFYARLMDQQSHPWPFFLLHDAAADLVRKMRKQKHYSASENGKERGANQPQPTSWAHLGPDWKNLHSTPCGAQTGLRPITCATARTVTF